MDYPMNYIQVASLLRQGKYREAEKLAYRKRIGYFYFVDLVKRFYTGSYIPED